MSNFPAEMLDMYLTGSPEGLPSKSGATLHPLLDYGYDDPFNPKKPTFKPRLHFTPETLIISLDSEYQLSEDGKHNIILSYQYVASTRGEQTDPIKGIIYTRKDKKGREQRLTLKKFVGKVVRQALKAKRIEKVPEQLYIVAHFLRADLSSFLDFFKETTVVQGIRKTLATINESYGIDVNELLDKHHYSEAVRVYDKSNNSHQVQVRFIDTQLLTPAQRGLAVLGDIVELPKLSIPEPYSIERMSDYLEADKAGFEAYAMRDAEIVHKYTMQLLDFTEKEFGKAFLPTTLASLAVSQFEQTLKAQSIKKNAFIGIGKSTQKTYSPDSSKYLTRTVESITGGAATLEHFAIECYHGGRNEAFFCGYTPIDDWYDYDLPSAYTTALIGLHPLDFNHYRQSKCLNDYQDNVCGIARVTFSFPPDTRYPSLPVKTANGLIYPLNGESYCTAAEIEVALQQGAEIEILEGFIIPWLNTEQRPFEQFVQFVRQKRKQYKKGEMFELLWKEIGNSLYGKLAQGLKGKKTFDTAKGYNKPVPKSKITCAYYACYVTGLVRAVVSELLNALPDNKQAISVTTDGFITNAHFDEINCNNPLTVRYQELLKRLDPDSDTPVLELKHQVKQLCCMKTRGQFTQIMAKNQPLILAKSSVQVPDKVYQQMKDSEDKRFVENQFMQNLYLNREPKQMIERSLLTSTRESFIKESDLIKKTGKVKLNLEFDMKRDLNEVTPITIDNQEYVGITTTPWRDIQAFHNARAYFDEWKENHCLKTPFDYADWREHYLTKTAKKGKKLRVRAEKTDVLLNQFLRCFVREAYGVEKSGYTYKTLAETLTEWGYKTSEMQVKNAKREKNAITEQCVANTLNNIALLKKLLEIAPKFDYQKFFVEPIDIAD